MSFQIEQARKKRHKERKILPEQSLKHLAIIMDGNGRWARRRRHSRIFGHVRGAKTACSVICLCARKKIPFLSLFALSAENTLRPKRELNGLNKLFERIFLKRAGLLTEENIKLHFLGELSFFSEKTQSYLKSLKEKTARHTGMNLIIALNYGGRQEIASAARRLAREAKAGRLDPEKADEKILSSFLDSSLFPPPDLIVRTGGDIRLSNFYLWSSAYSELHFIDVLWPDFNEAHLNHALERYRSARRKFGRLERPFPYPEESV